MEERASNDGRVLIAGDPQTAETSEELDLKGRVEKLGYEVVSFVSTAEQALKILENEPVDVCLIDVNLSGRVDGLSLAFQIKREYDLPFIFLTEKSDEQTFEQARKIGPSAFITKPFHQKELKYAIALAVKKEAALTALDKTEKDALRKAVKKGAKPQLKTSKKRSAIYLRKKDHFKKVEFDDILWVLAQSNYVKVQTVRTEFILCVTLQKLEEKLDDATFVRVHRSYLINIDKVEKIEGSRLYIGEKVIPISKNKKDEVFKHFKML